MEPQKDQLFEFGEFLLDPGERLLLRNGRQVPLTPKAFDTLLVLVQNSGRLVDKDRLMKAVWPDAFVEEAGLTRNISSLRKALGEGTDESRYIETVPRHGYRFVAEVQRIPTVRERLGSIEESPVVDEGVVGSDTSVVPGPLEPSRERQKQRLIRWLIISAIFVTAAIAIYLVLLRGGGPETTRSIKTIAVLPFRPLDETVDEHLGISMADTLITRLSSIQAINVRPTSSVTKYDAADQDWEVAGKALQVDAVLEGSIQRAGQRLRVTVRLISLAGRAPIWAGKFDEEVDDILAIQDSISERVASALQLRLSKDETNRLAKHPTKNLDAYHAYLKGRYFWNKRTHEGYKKAIAQFNEAIAKDPAYALAYSGLADCYVLGGDARSAEEAFSKAKAAAIKAIEIDDSLAEAHASLALAKLANDWDFSGAEAEFLRAISLNPNYPTAHQWYADCLLLQDRVEEAIASIQRAKALDPLSLVIGRDAARVFYFARRYDEAIEQCRDALEMDPKFYPSHVTLGDVYIQKKAYEEAIAAYQTAIDLSGGRLSMRSGLAYIYGMSGRRDEANKLLDELIEMAGQRKDRSFEVGYAYTGMGDVDSAFEWLEKAYREGSYRLLYLLIDPGFDPIRSDPRFDELSRRVRAGRPIVSADAS